MQKNKKRALFLIAAAVMLSVIAVAALPIADAEEAIAPFEDGAVSLEPGDGDGSDEGTDEAGGGNYDLWLWIIGIGVTSFGAILMFKPAWIKLD